MLLTKTRAYGLIELLLATAIASLLFALLIQLFLQFSESTFRFEQQASRNEVVHFAMVELQRDIRMAHYLPCGQTATQSSILNTATSHWWQNPFANQIRGYDDQQLPEAIVKDAISDQDALMILRAGKNRASIKSYAANRFTLAGEQSLAWLRTGSLLFACDPSHTVLFQAGVVNRRDRTIEVALDPAQKPGNCSRDLGPSLVGQCLQQGHSFQALSYIADYHAAIYYLSTSVSGNGRSIYREVLQLSGKPGKISSRRQELSAGIDTISFRYDLDLDRDGYAETHATAAEIRQQHLPWTHVSGVEIMLRYESSRHRIGPAVVAAAQPDRIHVAIR